MKDPQVGPFTVESENRLLSKRQHYKASHESFDAALIQAIYSANKTRDFCFWNVLNRYGEALVTVRGALWL